MKIINYLDPRELSIKIGILSLFRRVGEPFQLMSFRRVKPFLATALRLKLMLVLIVFIISSCDVKSKQKKSPETDKNKSEMEDKVTIMTLDPGHFHAALVQKSMYDQVNDTVFVFGPEGDDITDHLKRIDGFNTRDENPTKWVEKVYKGDDYLQKMIREKPGNVMVVSGRNNRKMEYIKAAIDAGIHVYADKPMAINSEDFRILEQVFQTANQKGLLVYDVMTERFEITTLLQKELSMDKTIFGELIVGTADEPAITKESVHHFFKYVSGKPLKRPDWFFDTMQAGEGLTDVSTHLVDLVQWEAFPNQTLKKSDIEIVDANRWTTDLSIKMFEKVTGAKEFPDFLKKDLDKGLLKVYCNGSMVYKIKDKYAKTSVIWNFEAPKGTGDTHYSIMRGTICDLIIKQGQEENYKPKLYVQINSDNQIQGFENKLKTTVESKIAKKYPGLKLQKINETTWAVDIPQRYKIGHEAHFGEVTKNYLKYLKNGSMPEWEVPNMIVKYYTTSQAFQFVKEK